MPNQQPRKRKRLRWILLPLLCVAAVAGVFGLRAALHRNHPIDSSKLAAVERGDIARSVVATGKIQPLTKVEVKSKASGIVKEVFVNYGDLIKQGQVLVELDKEELQA